MLIINKHYAVYKQVGSLTLERPKEAIENFLDNIWWLRDKFW